MWNVALKPCLWQSKCLNMFSKQMTTCYNFQNIDTLVFMYTLQLHTIFQWKLTRHKLQVCILTKKGSSSNTIHHHFVWYRMSFHISRDTFVLYACNDFIDCPKQHTFNIALFVYAGKRFVCTSEENVCRRWYRNKREIRASLFE